MARMLVPFLVALGLVPLVTVAQTSPGKPPSPPTPAGPPIPVGRLPNPSASGLLSSPPVQEELNLTDSQKGRLAEVDRREIRRAGDLESAAKAENAGQPEIASEQVKVGRFDIGKEVEAERLNILNRSQKARLEQIWIQAQGPMAFLRAEVQSRLNMDPEQVQLINEIIAGANGELKQLSDAATDEVVRSSRPVGKGKRRIDPEKAKAVLALTERAHKESLKIQQTATTSIMKLLSKRQRETYTKMCGEPFDRSRLASPATTEPKSKAGVRVPE